MKTEGIPNFVFKKPSTPDNDLKRKIAKYIYLFSGIYVNVFVISIAYIWILE